MSRDQQFRCVVDRDDAGQVARVVVTVDDGYGPREEVCLNGSKAGLVAGTLHTILRDGGVSARQWTTSGPLVLDQGVGSQAWLLLKAVKPLRRMDRIDEVGDGVARMSREEAAYWFAKAHQPRGLRAVRMLLSDDGRRR